MKSLLYFSILNCFLLASCSKTPSYNPFDDDFDVSADDLRRAGCHIATLGEYSIQFEQCNDRFRPYYLLSDTDLTKAYAKGFSYPVDKHFLPYRMCSDGTEEDSIQGIPIDIEEFKSAIAPYDYQVIAYEHPAIEITNINHADTIRLTIAMEYESRRREIVIVNRIIRFKKRSYYTFK